MKEPLTIGIGVLAAAVAPPLVMIGWAGSEFEFSLASLAMLAILYLGSAMVVSFAGLPAFFTLRHFGRANWWTAALTGGALADLVMLGLAGVSEPLSYWLLWFGTGSVAASVFWGIWSMCTDVASNAENSVP